MINTLLKHQQVIAHRGASAQAPENTLIAFERAKQLGASMIEFDVMLSQDNIPIVIHDGSIDRTTDGVGDVMGFRYEELLQYDAGAWFADAFSGQHIPSLEEVIQRVEQWRIGANVEIKPGPGQEIETTQAVLQCLENNWHQDQRLLLSSFSLVVLEQLHMAFTPYPIGLLLSVWDEQLLEMAKRFDCYSIHLDIRFLTPDRVAQIKQAGFKVLTYTINEPAIAETVFSWGVDGIFSDCPVDMLPYLK